MILEVVTSTPCWDFRVGGPEELLVTSDLFSFDGDEWTVDALANGVATPGLGDDPDSAEASPEPIPSIKQI